MTKEQFEHAIRAAGAVLNANEVLVIGSQAVHASTDEFIPATQASIEADIAALDDKDGRLADLLDSAIGELSLFQDAFGYYVQGVTQRTAVLPPGWRERLVPYVSERTGGVKALCLEIHDLWLSKAVASRPKDRAFCAVLLDKNLVASSTLRQRLAVMSTVDAGKRQIIDARILAHRQPTPDGT